MTRRELTRKVEKLQDEINFLHELHGKTNKKIEDLKKEMENYSDFHYRMLTHKMNSTFSILYDHLNVQMQVTPGTTKLVKNSNKFTPKNK